MKPPLPTWRFTLSPSHLVTFDERGVMTDLLFVLGTILFFVASGGLMALCARLMEENA